MIYHSWNIFILYLGTICYLVSLIQSMLMRLFKASSYTRFVKKFQIEISIVTETFFLTRFIILLLFWSVKCLNIIYISVYEKLIGSHIKP